MGVKKMPFFKKRPKTAKQKAQGTQMRILIRLACCAYIVFYVIIPMLRPTSGEDTMNPTVRVAIAIAFIVIVAVIFALTINETIRTWKAGLFRADAYTDDTAEGQESGNQNPEIESGDDSDGDGDSDDTDDDEYEYYEDDDEEDYEDDEDDEDDDEDD